MTDRCDICCRKKTKVVRHIEETLLDATPTTFTHTELKMPSTAVVRKPWNLWLNKSQVLTAELLWRQVLLGHG